MIPLCTKESVKYTDADGVIWEFIPKYGMIERELISTIGGANDKSPEDQISAIDDFIDRILIGWSGAKMPQFPETRKPSTMFSQYEKGQIISFWNKANELTIEQKKS
jgi:hypothetical protein